MIPRTERTFVWVLLGSVLLVAGVAWWAPTPTDWSDSFAADDSRPYASEVVRTALPELFPERTVQTVEAPPFLRLRDSTTTGGAYLFVAARFAPDPRATDRLLAYAAHGNTVFVAAHQFDGPWADTLGLRTRPRRPALAGVTGQPDTVRLRLRTTDSARPVPVREETAAYVFDSRNTAPTTVLGTVRAADTTAPSFVGRPYGEGRLLLSSTPRAFTNVHALDEQTAPYVWGALSHVPADADPVWWDAYHKPGRTEARTPLRFVLSTPALRHAYVVAIVGVLLFLLVHARRRQRVIPEIDAPENKTLDFVDTLGRLAHRRGDADTVARRRVTYLLASVRDRLGVSDDPESDGWVRQVAARSGVPRDDVTALADVMAAVRATDAVSEEMLKTLDRRIQAFREARTR
jgi:hypothetical protein